MLFRRYCHHSKNFLFLWIFLVLLLSTGIVQAQLPDTLHIVSDDNYPPFIFRDDSGKLTGLLVDQWQLWSEQTGVPIQITGMDWGDAIARMYAGEYDIIETIFKNEERLQRLEFSEPYVKIDVPIFFSSKISGISGAESLHGFVVAVKSGDAAISTLKSRGIDDLQEYPSYEAIIAAAQREEVVVFAMDMPPAMYFLHKAGLQGKFRYTDPLYRGEFHRAVLKGNGAMLKAIEKGFDSIPDDALQHAERHWYGKQTESSNSLKQISLFLATILLITAFLAIWNRLLQQQVKSRTSMLQREMERSRGHAEALRESEEKYRLIVEDSNDPIFTFLPDGSLRYVNQAFADLIGDEPDKMLDRHIQDIFSDREYRGLVSTLISCIRTGVETTQEIRYSVHGELHYFLTSFNPLKDENGKVFTILCIAKNISKRKRAENALHEKSEELRQSEERLNLAIEGSGVGLWDWMIQTDEMIVNERWADMIGYTIAELKPMTIDVWRRLTNPDDAEITVELLKDHLAGKIESVDCEIRMQHKAGHWVWILSRGKITEWDSEGKPLRMTGTHLDITERIHNEEERNQLHERLQQAEKMEALGTLAGGVAHDLNNVLGILVGYAELLLLELPEGDSLRGHANQILNGGQRAAAIIQDLLTLARRGVRTTKTVNLNHIVEEFLASSDFDSLRKLYPEIEVTSTLDKDLPNIKGSELHLGKSLINLVANAMEAIPGAGKIFIETGMRHLDIPMDESGMPKTGDFLYLAISDTGSGIAEADQKRIFEPFYTKKVMGRSGTGLGLAVVWGTVKDHQGHIDVESHEGKGSRFTLYFPPSRDPITQEHIQIDRAEYLGHGEHILVVDDMEEQRSLATAMLTSLGYKVASVEDGHSAVEYVQAHQPDLVVLDMILTPEMDGLDTYRAILKIRPDQKAIVVSGYSETDRVHEIQELGAETFIRKPYVHETLGNAIRCTLDQ